MSKKKIKQTNQKKPCNVGSLGICIRSLFGKHSVTKKSTRIVLWSFVTWPVPFFCPEGHYIFLETDKFSQAGQSFRLVSRPFCAPAVICVTFTYHMYGLGQGTKLRLLLGSPAGSPPSSLWERVGPQSPEWLNTSVTIPSGHQQPMQVRDGETGPVSVIVGPGEGDRMPGIWGRNQG